MSAQVKARWAEVPAAHADINRNLIDETTLLRALLDRIEQVETPEQIIALADLFMYLACANRVTEDVVAVSDERMLRCCSWPPIAFS